MTPNTIELTPDGRIMAYEFHQEKTINVANDQWDMWKEGTYNKALEAAKREVVYFKPDDYAHVIHQLFNDLIIDVSEGESFEQNKPYPIPEGYDIKIEHDFISVVGKEGKKVQKYNGKYAILVPKEKPVVCSHTYAGQSIDGIVRCELCGEPKEELKTVGAIDAGKFKNWADAGIGHKVPKQQSIEEAAEKSCSYDWKITREAYEEGFIIGVKSQAAKEYWYEQFKQEKI